MFRNLGKYQRRLTLQARLSKSSTRDTPAFHTIRRRRRPNLNLCMVSEFATTYRDAFKQYLVRSIPDVSQSISSDTMTFNLVNVPCWLDDSFQIEISRWGGASSPTTPSLLATREFCLIGKKSQLSIGTQKQIQVIAYVSDRSVLEISQHGCYDRQNVVDKLRERHILTPALSIEWYLISILSHNLYLVRETHTPTRKRCVHNHLNVENQSLACYHGSSLNRFCSGSVREYDIRFKPVRVRDQMSLGVPNPHIAKCLRNVKWILCCPAPGQLLRCFTPFLCLFCFYE